MASRASNSEERRRIVSAIESLTDPDLRDLINYARFRGAEFARMGVGEDADDLVQDTFLAAWTARRGCAIDVHIRAFFKNCIRSIANQRIKASFARASKRDEFRRYQAQCSGIPDKGREIAHNIVGAVRMALRDDGVALSVLESMLDGKPPRQASNDLGIETRAYNSARKRIKRRAHHAAAIAADGFGCGGGSRSMASKSLFLRA